MQFSIREMFWITAACGFLMLLSAPAGAGNQRILLFGCLIVIAGAALVSLGIARRDQQLHYAAVFLGGCFCVTVGLILGGVGIGAALGALLIPTDTGL